MVETFGAAYVSLHVRVSNAAAIHLYRETLGFRQDKVETKYYADGEDAFCMRLDLGPLREQIRLEREEEKEAEGEGAVEGKADGDRKKGNGEAEPNGKASAHGGSDEHADEGEPAGDVGKDPDAKKQNGSAAAADAGKKRKVKVGRALGVGELVERDESKH